MKIYSKHYKSFLLSVISVMTLLSLSGCLKEQEEPPTDLKSNGYMGCSGALVADDGVSVRVDIVMPEKATEVQVMRNGTIIGSVFPTDSSMTFMDSNLPSLGDVYRYACRAIVKGEGVLGYNQPTVQTNAVDSPDFAGIDTVTIQNKIEAKITWKSPDLKGAKPAKYKIYVNLETGAHVDLTATPLATVTAPATTYTVKAGELGDNLKYAFAVLACTSNDLCSGGTVYKNATTLDNGAPLTTGASAWKGIAGGLQFTVPWTHKMGEIAKRYVYVNKTTNTTGGLDWANQYQQLKVINTTSLIYNPSLWSTFTDVKIVDSRIIEKSTQHFIIRDIDTQGNQANLYYLKIDNTGDLSAPVFAGYSAVVVNPGDEDTQVKLTFMSIDREGTADPGQATGAAYYKVYYTSEPYVSVSTPNPNDPCKFGTAYNQQFSAMGYPPNVVSNIVIPNLTPRTMYRFCLKAVDTAGNESADQAASDLLTVTSWDKTAPQFDGIQSISGVSVDEEYKIKLEYNPATDLNSNVSYYKLRAWITAGGPTAPGTYASAIRSTTVNRFVADGWIDYAYLVNNTDLKYDDLPTDVSAAGKYVRVVIDACDDAHTIPGMSTDNCTAFAESTAMSIQPPDIVPPQLFLGIDSTWFGTLPTAASTVNGQVIVKFRKPSLFDSHATPEELNQYQDYAGFKVYSLDTSNVPTLIKSCPCATPGACNTTTDLQCTVDNLKPDKLYKLYARAYDTAGNVTKYVDPATKNGSQRVFDGVAPTFAAGVAVIWNNAQSRAELTWNAATDNQDSASVITYQVFRKKTTWTAGEKSNPDSVSGALRGTSTTTSYYDTDKVGDAPGDKLASGGNFYYLVCAKDAQNNRTCDNIDKNLFLADVVAPIISTITTDKTNDSLITYKKWYIKFYMEENESTFSRMTVTVRSKYSAGAASVATSSDPLDSKGSDLSNISFTSTDAGVNKKGYIQISNLTGSSGLSGYMNYFIELADENGNRTSFTLSVQFDNSLTFTSIANSAGTQSGGKLVVVKGSGFSLSSNNNAGVSTVVRIDGQNCTGVNILSSTILTCTTPAGATSGPKIVSVINPDGTTVSLNNGYTYTDGTSYPNATCDIPPQNAYTAQFSAGTGSSIDPFVICNYQQLALIANASYVDGGYYFRVDENLDLSAWTTFSPIGTTAKPFIGFIDFTGHMIFNLTYNLSYTSSSSSTVNYMGLFGVVKTSFSFKNAVMYNFNFTATNTSGNGCVASCVAAQGGFGHFGLALGMVAKGVNTSVVMTGNSIINSSITSTLQSTYKLIFQSDVGGLFGYINTSLNSASNVINNNSFESITVNNIWGVPWDYYDGWDATFVRGSASGALGGRYVSNTLDAFSNINVKSSTIHCSSYCGGILGRANQGNITSSSVMGTTINIKSKGDGNIWYFPNNYFGATNVGGVIGLLEQTTTLSNISFSGTINRQNQGETSTQYTTIVGNYYANRAGGYGYNSDGQIGGIAGAVKFIGANGTISNVTSSGSINSTNSGSGQAIIPLRAVGGLFGRLSLGRGSGSATNVTVNLSSTRVSAFSIHCEQICGGLIGKFEMTATDPTNSGQYAGTLNITQSGVSGFTSTNNATFTLAYPAITANGYQTADSGVGGFIGAVEAMGNKLTMTDISMSPPGTVTFLSSLSPYVNISKSYVRASFTGFTTGANAKAGGAIGTVQLLDQTNTGALYSGVTSPKVVTITDSFVSTDLLTLGVAATNSAAMVGTFNFQRLTNVVCDSGNINGSYCTPMGKDRELISTTVFPAVAGGAAALQASPTVVTSVNRVYSTGIAAKYITNLATSGSTLSPASTFCDPAQNGNNFLNSTTVSATNFYDAVTSCSGYTTKTTSELQDRSSGDVYSAAGWDFSTVWKWPSASPAYPVLQWMAE